ncbi:hypothetical protein [Amycolatopsis anabasis]|uniref:hypothetical protein n=1 Tax=Amycolatopsis anabasis TaxID=1840409 RepID=UPI00131E0B87|nr:hypothetical protein [Amycolatopsis anabasis]
MVERSADPQRAADRILEVAAACNVTLDEAITLVKTVAGQASLAITRDANRDRVRVAHEAAMHVCIGGVGAPVDAVVKAMESRLAQSR